jgi:serine protease
MSRHWGLVIRDVILVVCVCLAGTVTAAEVAPLGDEPNGVVIERPQHCPNDVIVRFSPDLDEAGRATLLDAHGCSILRTCEPGNMHRVRIPPGETPEHAVAWLLTEDGVEHAELNYYASIYLTPDDPYYHYQWNLDNSVTGGIHTKSAWDIEVGDPCVIIAVVDTGVAYENYGAYRQAPDLAETSFVPGYDFANNDAHPNDDQGHGTHVTGTIAQSTNNDLGVAGVAFRCSIMPVKVLDNTGAGDHFTIAEGIYFAADHGAKVLNMSFGSTQTSTTLQQAVAYAYQHGVTLVCAAGNDYQKGDQPSYPAAYDDYCIAVAATRYDNTHAPYSTSGAYVDIAAPGGDTLVDQNQDGYPDGILQQTFSVDPEVFAYFFFEGTSMATPHVSGVAGLLVSAGVTQPEEVREAIQMTARDAGAAGWDPEYGWGIVDAAAALEYATPQEP